MFFNSAFIKMFFNKAFIKMCDSKKSKFINRQLVCGLLTSLLGF